MPADTPGARLRAARERAGLTQAGLAALAGLTQGQVGHLERGVRTLDLDTAHRLALAMGEDPHAIDPRLASSRR